MSIIIKGMEMPEKRTILTIFPNGYVAIYDAKDSFIGETKAFPVPKHGRLIDADALLSGVDDGDDVMFVWAITDAPTIIPADRKE